MHGNTERKQKQAAAQRAATHAPPARTQAVRSRPAQLGSRAEIEAPTANLFEEMTALEERVRLGIVAEEVADPAQFARDRERYLAEVEEAEAASAPEYLDVPQREDDGNAAAYPPGMSVASRIHHVHRKVSDNVVNVRAPIAEPGGEQRHHKHTWVTCATLFGQLGDMNLVAELLNDPVAMMDGRDLGGACRAALDAFRLMCSLKRDSVETHNLGQWMNEFSHCGDVERMHCEIIHINGMAVRVMVLHLVADLTGHVLLLHTQRSAAQVPVGVTNESRLCTLDYRFYAGFVSFPPERAARETR